MSASVLYDIPGPKARRRALIGTVVGALVILALVGIAAKRLNDNGQFAGELWSPLFNPGDESFVPVWKLIGKGLTNTLVAAVLAIILSLVVGVLLGVARMMSGRYSRIPILIFIQLFRGLPVIVTIVIVWRFMFELGLGDLIAPLPGSNALWYLVLGLTLYNCVIIAEILRAGVASLPSGQGEAALAVGMTGWQAMREVLLPQAFRVMLPALISQLVVVLKDTSLVAFLSLGYLELLNRGGLISQNLDNTIQTLFLVGLIFITINYGLSKLAVWMEARLSRASGADTSAIADQVPAT
ncbi:amino acid ABC transporter permease [Nocardioides salsibiostraticola]